MSQTKYKLPDDVRQSVLGYVRGYKRRVKWYKDQREAIIYRTPVRFETYIPDPAHPSQSWAYQPRGNGTSNPTLNAADALVELESHPEVRIMRAVEQAQVAVGVEVRSEQERNKLRRAVLDSCVDGRDFMFEYTALAMGRSSFYRARQRFLWQIAKILHMA
jgi:hypothetical protein